ncbi:hypothetical protein RN001_003988 [Aquatica leii]|uniref:GT23 domain-containing protein n=1 Tax=Aquatica leii TaxID=1421715 RepID=A0AAN7SL44_9COLE|nr:hypothetical protein RN001_003988 [Aquatica leii]
MKKLKNIFNRNKNSLSIVEKVLSVVFESKRALLTNMEKLTEVDGFNAWRNKESADLSNIVQPFAKSSKLHECQKNSMPNKLCKYRCGLGCQMHHLIHSMILAYGLERTLILESTNWQYHESGWDKVFLPLSSSCTTIGNVPTVNWPGSNVSRVIRLRPTKRVTPRSQYLPLAVPEDLVNRIKIIHGNPIAWWVGQIIKYVWRLQPRTTNYINNQMEKFGIKNPFVGVQIRRTDKIYYAEAKYQAVERYMDVVDEYYKSIEIKTNFTKRRVYIATEEYSVIKEVKTKYPHYEILHNQNIPKIPKINFARSFDNIFDLILDVHILLRSDLLVCTLTSNLCRLIYALLQNDHVDGSANIVSLDAVYWYHNQLHNKRKVILKHHPENAAEIDLVPGDIVDVTVVTDYSLNGYSHGTNLRTRRKVLWFWM